MKVSYSYMLDYNKILTRDCHFKNIWHIIIGIDQLEIVLCALHWYWIGTVQISQTTIARNTKLQKIILPLHWTISSYSIIAGNINVQLEAQFTNNSCIYADTPIIESQTKLPILQKNLQLWLGEWVGINLLYEDALLRQLWLNIGIQNDLLHKIKYI